jgi:Protein of unknown function (DUF4446)
MSAQLAIVKIYLTIAAPYLALAALLVAVIVLGLELGLRRRFVRLSLGRNGSIEESLGILSREVRELKEFRTEVEKYLKFAETRLRGAVQGVGLVRFNPFEGRGQGGNQSFAVALLDEHGSGVVLSTLYSRDRVGVYGKNVENGTSTYDLTPEEKAAIEQAVANIAKKRG